MAFVLRRNIIPYGAGVGPVIEIYDETDAEGIASVETERECLGALYEWEQGTHFLACVQTAAEKLERDWRSFLATIDDGIAGDSKEKFPIHDNSGKVIFRQPRA